ncbi:hypothetical protein M5K25_000572 [Dendrobium thyrsiflorum]|uniref:Uncharacterized protein n=1 Tax=Dendrobium thyrsiflorum TaxID=117978 RepID=A0ABD0WC00_DENTH
MGPTKERLEIMEGSEAWVVPNAKKFRYCGINPELEYKLDLMFMDIVATGVHAWTPNERIDHEIVHGDSKQLDTTTDSFEDPSQSFDSISKCSHQITQLNYCITINNIEAPLRSVAIKILEQTTEAFEDMPLYLFSTSFLRNQLSEKFLWQFVQIEEFIIFVTVTKIMIQQHSFIGSL